MEERFLGLIGIILFLLGLGIGAGLICISNVLDKSVTVMQLKKIEVKVKQDSIILYKDSLIMERCYESLNFKSK